MARVGFTCTLIGHLIDGLDVDLLVGLRKLGQITQRIGLASLLRVRALGGGGAYANDDDRLRLRLRLRPGVGAVADGLRFADLRGTCHAHERVGRHEERIEILSDDRPCEEFVLGFHVRKQSHGALAHLPAHG